LISGEGLINAVRDPVFKTDKDGEKYCADEGVTDKRLLTFEGEFASVLKILRQIYSELSKDQPGMFGCVVARSEAQVLRLNLFCKGGVLDGSAKRINLRDSSLILHISQSACVY
jgi:hypothetical protein